VLGNLLRHSCENVENVSKLNRIHIHVHCVNWSAGISYPHSTACPLTGSFLLGFSYCDGATEISYSDARSLVTFSRDFILWQLGTCFYVWLWYKRERTVLNLLNSLCSSKAHNVWFYSTRVLHIILIKPHSMSSVDV
jgi:hypothetical protein